MTHAARLPFLYCLTLLSSTAFAGTLVERNESRQPVVAPRPLPWDPITSYEKKNVRGWTVLVDYELRDQHPELCADCLELLDAKLFMVEFAVPKAAAEKLKTVTIWLEYFNDKHPGAVYHPDPKWLREHALNPKKARCVELANAKRFISSSKVQPAVILHELSHAWHHQFVPDGFRNADLKTAYEAAKTSGRYDRTLHYSGRQVKHYALTTPQEYFAESSEAYFATNDFYPFVRPELEEHDPDLVPILRRLWLVVAK